MMKTVHMVQQTHWDREWYFTREDSNVLLHNEMHQIARTLTNDNTSYCLDAQSVLIDDFFSKYQSENISDLIKKKKLFVGPWYTQSDTLLVSKEAIISNLRYGIKTARKYGHVMNVGYIPDAFGQSNYMPSILKNLDIDYAMFQRGLYSEQHHGFLNFMWKSPDGNEIPAHNMLHGYAVFGNYELTDEFVTKRAIPALKELEKFSVDENHLLIPCGWDQTSINGNFEEFINFLNDKLPMYKFIVSDYETFMQSASYKNELQVTGDLRATERSRLHRTIGSGRYDIKYLADQADYLLINQLQPLAVIYHQFSSFSLQPQIDTIWKELFDCHAHDSIGGCNSDDTNGAIKERLKQSIRTIESLINLIKKTIALSIKNVSNRELLLLFNTNPKTNNRFEQVIVYGPNKGIELTTIDGQLVEFNVRQVESITAGTKLVMIDGIQQEIPEDNYYKITIDITHQVDGLGYDSLLLSFIPEQKEQEIRDTDKIENSKYKVDLNGDKLLIIDKQNNETLEIGFLDDADNGDTYDFDYVKNSEVRNGLYRIVSSKKNSYVSKLVLETDIEVDRAEDNSHNNTNLKSYPITIAIELTLEGQLDINIELDNINTNHRLRMVLKPTNLLEIQTGNGYSMQRVKNDYKHLENWQQKGYAERPTNIFNFERHLAIITKNSKYNLVTSGCKEVSNNENEVKITLFRSVGVLGKANLNNRPGRASGINNKIIETPDSQLLTKLNFKFKLIEAIDSFNASETMYKRNNHYHLQELDYFENRLDRFYLKGFSKELPAKLSLVNCITSLHCSMIRDDHDYIYIRLFNSTENPVQIPTIFSGLEQVNLIDKLLAAESSVAPRGYLTFRVKKERND